MDCEVCIMAKMEKLPFSENRIRGSRPSEIVHTDPMGPIKPASFPGGNRFIIVFVDDHTRFAKAYSVKHKNEAGDCLEKFLITTRNLLGKDEKVCYIGGKFSDVMKQEKIEYNVAPPHTPELNGTAERFNKSLQNKIRALMVDSGLPESMWILGVEAAVHIIIILHKIRRFGCVAHAKISITEKKFSEREIKGIMVGYTPTGYVLWHPSTGKFLHSRHVRCNEKLVYKDIYKIQSEETTNQKRKKNQRIRDKEQYKYTHKRLKKINQRKKNQKRNKKIRDQRREKQKTTNQTTQKQRNAIDAEEMRKPWKTEKNTWQSEEPK